MEALTKLHNAMTSKRKGGALCLPLSETLVWAGCWRGIDAFHAAWGKIPGTESLGSCRSFLLFRSAKIVENIAHVHASHGGHVPPSVLSSFCSEASHLRTTSTSPKPRRMQNLLVGLINSDPVSVVAQPTASVSTIALSAVYDWLPLLPDRLGERSLPSSTSKFYPSMAPKSSTVCDLITKTVYYSTIFTMGDCPQDIVNAETYISVVGGCR